MPYLWRRHPDETVDYGASALEVQNIDYGTSICLTLYLNLRICYLLVFVGGGGDEDVSVLLTEHAAADQLLNLLVRLPSAHAQVGQVVQEPANVTLLSPK